MVQESDFQTKFGQNNRIHGVFELKHAKKGTYSFAQLPEHQAKNLLNVSSEEGLYHKISDFGGRASGKKPLDCFYLKNTPGYVVICFYEFRKGYRFYYIEIRRLLEFSATHTRKSAHEDEIAQIASHIMKV